VIELKHIDRRDNTSFEENKKMTHPYANSEKKIGFLTTSHFSA
jgi:hypothetical protein